MLLQWQRKFPLLKFFMGYWLQRISIIMVAVGGIVLAPVVCLFMLQGDFVWLGAFIGLMLLVLFLSQDVKSQWTYVICAMAVTGTLNFLPINFSVFELTIMLVFGHFFLSEVIFKKRGVVVGDRWMLAGITIVAVIVFYHWFKEGIGLKIIGGETVGARKSVSMVLGIIGYFIVLTLCQNQWKLLNRLPLIYFIVALLTSIPFFVSTIVPSLGPAIYAFYGDVNADAYLQEIMGEERIGRVGKWANLATAMELALLAYFPVKDWWRPNRWFVAILWLAGFWMCMASGYRSTVFGYIVAFVFGSFASNKFKSVFLWSLAAIILAVAVAGQGSMFNLPLKMQRAISFLPGKWDYSVVSDAGSSNDFREQIQSIYIDEYMNRSPWVGSGFNYDAREVTGKENFIQWDHNSYDMFKGFIIRKDFHVGWISLYDTIGIVGGVGFFILFFTGLRWLVAMMRMSWDEKTPPILVWLMATWVPTVLSFFTVFGAIQSAFPLLCVYGALIWCTHNTMKEEWEKAGKLKPEGRAADKEKVLQEELLRG